MKGIFPFGLSVALLLLLTVPPLLAAAPATGATRPQRLPPRGDTADRASGGRQAGVSAPARRV